MQAKVYRVPLRKTEKAPSTPQAPMLAAGARWKWA
jgi:hypothetical protein